MARLTAVTVPLDERGHHDLAGMAEAAASARRGRVVPAAQSDRHAGACRRDVQRFLRQVPDDTVVLLDEAYIEFVAPEHRIDGAGPGPALSRMSLCCGRSLRHTGWPGCGSGTASASPELAEKLWSMQLPFGMGITSLVAVAASYDAEDQLRQRILRITGERDYLRRRLRAMGVYSTDSHANFVYLPPSCGSAVARGVR